MSPQMMGPAMRQPCIRLFVTPVDCSLPGSSVHGILQARILEWVAISFSRNLPDPGIEPGCSCLENPTDGGAWWAAIYGVAQSRPCVVWKGFPAFPAHLRMRPVSRGNSRRATWVGPQAVGMQPWALSLPDKELCLREALAVCTPRDPEPSAKRPGS